jgi:hypothetical protein
MLVTTRAAGPFNFSAATGGVALAGAGLAGAGVGVTGIWVADAAEFWIGAVSGTAEGGTAEGGTSDAGATIGAEVFTGDLTGE